MEAKRAVQARLQSAVTSLRIAVRSIENSNYTSESVEQYGGAVIAALHSVLAAKGTKKYSLAMGLKDASVVLDEPLVCSSLLALHNISLSPSDLCLLKEFVECDRFGTVLSMAIFGNETLKAAVTGLCSTCEAHKDMQKTKARLEEISI